MTDSPILVPEPAEPDEIGGTVALGEDSDCETCGGSYNSLDWYLEGGLIELRSSIGCYGGDSLSTEDLDAASAFVRDLQRVFPDAAADLAAEADRMRAAVTAARG